MVELRYRVTDVEGVRVVACVDSAAAVVLDVIGQLCSTYPIDAIAEVMTRIGAPVWREITTNGREALSEGRTWVLESRSVSVSLRAV